MTIPNSLLAWSSSRDPRTSNDWLRAISILLLLKDLSDVVDGSYPIQAATDERAWRRADRQAFGNMNVSVDTITHRTIPPKLSAYEGSSSMSSAHQLMGHLVATSSANTGARQAKLYQLLFQTHLREGQEPVSHMSTIKGTYFDMVSPGETLSDSTLAFALLLSLPPFVLDPRRHVLSRSRQSVQHDHLGRLSRVS